jgi:hypothetical protein
MEDFGNIEIERTVQFKGAPDLTHTTAGLDMPKFFGPNRERRDNPPDDVDPFALRRRTMKPVVAAVQGLCLTIGIAMMLAADIVIAADSARFWQMESRRGSDGRLNSDNSSCSWRPDPTSAGTAGDAARWGGSIAVAEKTATPF